MFYKLIITQTHTLNKRGCTDFHPAHYWGQLNEPDSFPCSKLEEKKTKLNRLLSSFICLFWGHNVHSSWHIVSWAMPGGMQPHLFCQKWFHFPLWLRLSGVHGKFIKRWETWDKENEKHLFDVLGNSPFSSFSSFLQCCSLLHWASNHFEYCQWCW